jgi:hypothetical protein
MINEVEQQAGKAATLLKSDGGCDTNAPSQPQSGNGLELCSLCESLSPIMYKYLNEASRESECPMVFCGSRDQLKDTERSC